MATIVPIVDPLILSYQPKGVVGLTTIDLEIQTRIKVELEHISKTHYLQEHTIIPPYQSPKVVTPYTQDPNYWITVLKAKGVKVIAWDFDKTITLKHTSGCQQIEKIPSVSISSDFLLLCEAAHRGGLKQCVVTFADPRMGRKGYKAGARLVREVLIKQLTQETMASLVIIPYYPQYDKPILDGIYNSKHIHLKIATEYFQVNPAEVLLVDDTPRNLVVAKQEGYKTMCVMDGFKFSDFTTFQARTISNGWYANTGF
jgi:hypothetical protein